MGCSHPLILYHFPCEEGVLIRFDDEVMVFDDILYRL
jgi:hypothetical protein